jgi:hypothetical protein
MYVWMYILEIDCGRLTISVRCTTRLLDMNASCGCSVSCMCVCMYVCRYDICMYVCKCVYLEIDCGRLTISVRCTMRLLDMNAYSGFIRGCLYHVCMCVCMYI